MKVAICDDERIQLQVIQDYVKEWVSKQNKLINVFSFSSAKQLWMENNAYSYDIYLLDIQMDDMNGMELAKLIRQNNEKGIIIFSTGIVDYIYDGFNVDALNYLLKPIKKDQLFTCLNKAISILEKEEKFITLNIDKETKILKIKKMHFVESISHYLEIHYADEIYTVKMNLSDLEKILPNTVFMKPHRSFIVNIADIIAIRKKELILHNSIVIPIARGRWEEMNARFILYHKSEGKL